MRDLTANANFPADLDFRLIHVAIERFNKSNHDLKLNATDIYNLFQIASFELNIRGSSPWIDAFTGEEWITFGYLRDLVYYFYNGGGQRSAVLAGNVHTNATLTLLQNSSEPLHFGFTHATDITQMGARLIFERLSCNSTAASQADICSTGLKEAVISHTECKGGPGYSCRIEKYDKVVGERLESGLAKECNLPDSRSPSCQLLLEL